MLPPASDVVVTFKVVAVMVMLRFAVAVFWVGVSESVTVTVKLIVPVTFPLGVPEITPVVAFKLSPAGKLPVVTAQVSGVIPPVAASVAPG